MMTVDELYGDEASGSMQIGGSMWMVPPEQRDALSQNSTYSVTKTILVFYID